MVRTSVTHSPNVSCASFLFLPVLDVICGLSGYKEMHGSMESTEQLGYELEISMR